MEISLIPKSLKASPATNPTAAATNPMVIVSATLLVKEPLFKNHRKKPIVPITKIAAKTDIIKALVKGRRKIKGTKGGIPPIR